MTNQRWHKYDIGERVTVQDDAHPATGRPTTWQGTILRVELFWGGVGYTISQDNPHHLMNLFVHEKNIARLDSLAKAKAANGH